LNGLERKKKVYIISEQLIVPPHAIVDDMNLPLKGTKSKTTDYLRNRYSEVSLVPQNLPQN